MRNLLLGLALILGWALVPTDAHAQNPTCPTRPVSDSSNACASTAFVNNFSLVSRGSISVKSFGALGDGVTDDITAVRSAVTYSQSNGCLDIIFPPGTYALSDTIQLGNGSSSVASTVCAPRLLGQGSMNGFAAQDGLLLNNTVTLKRTGGGTAGAIVLIQGPLSGWEVSGMKMDCSSVSQWGLLVTSGIGGNSRDLTMSACLLGGIGSSTVSALPSGVANVDSLHNVYNHVVVNVPCTASARGIFVSGVLNIGDTDLNVFDDVAIIFVPGCAQSVYGLYLGPSDTNQFRNFHFINGQTATQSVCVAFDYTTWNAFPGSNLFIGIDASGCHTSWFNFGSPATSGFFGNVVRDPWLGNGASLPVNLPGTQIGLYSDWTPWTPTFVFTGGTGVSATSVNATYSIVGKTLAINIAFQLNFTTEPTSFTISTPAGFTYTAASTPYSGVDASSRALCVTYGSASSTTIVFVPDTVASGNFFAVAGSGPVQ